MRQQKGSQPLPTKKRQLTPAFALLQPMMVHPIVPRRKPPHNLPQRIFFDDQNPLHVSNASGGAE
jgi:hypothetical protein